MPKFVIRLEAENGKVLKEVKVDAPPEQMTRIVAWWKHYFGDPTTTAPSPVAGAPPVTVPMDDVGLFELWVNSILSRLRTLTKEHESRQEPPDLHGKLLD